MKYAQSIHYDAVKLSLSEICQSASPDWQNFLPACPLFELFLKDVNKKIHSGQAKLGLDGILFYLACPNDQHISTLSEILSL